MALGPALLGLANGISSGMQLGQNIRGAIDQGQLRSTIADSQQQAQQDTDNQAQQLIQAIPNPNDANTPLYQVGDQTYTDQNQALTAARAQLPSAAETFASKYAPAVVNQLMSQGKPEQAAQFQNWARQTAGQAVIRGYGQALGAFGQDGSVNHDQFINGIKMANAAIPNGIDVNDIQANQDANGKPTGTYTLSYTQNGQPQTATVTRDQLYMQGMAHADPMGAFSNYGQMMMGGIQFNRDLAKASALQNLKTQGDVAVENAKGANQLANTAAQGEQTRATNAAQSNNAVQEYAGKTAVDNNAGAIKLPELLNQTADSVNADYAARLRGSETSVNAARAALAMAPNDPVAQQSLVAAQNQQAQMVAEKNAVASTASTLVPMLRQQNPQVNAAILKDVARQMVTNSDAVNYVIDRNTGGVLRQVQSGGRTYTVDAQPLSGDQVPASVQQDFVNRYGDKNPVTGETWNFTPGGEAGAAFAKAAGQRGSAANPFAMPGAAAPQAAGATPAPRPARPVAAGIAPMGTPSQAAVATPLPSQNGVIPFGIR